MKVFEGSLAYRAARRAVPWITRSARFSLSGRFVLTGASAVSRACADSRVLGRAPSPRLLAPDDRSASVAALAWSYLRLRKGLSRACAEAASAGRRALSGSTFAAGGWVLAAGAGVFALGAGLAASASGGVRLAASVCLLAVGALTIWIGRRLVPALRDSVLLGRTCRARCTVLASAGSPSALDGDNIPGAVSLPRRSAAVLAGIGMALALVAGVVAGLGGPRLSVGVVAFVLALGLLALVVWRPEVMLLVAAAFPWVDWVARRALGGFGAAWDDAFLLLFILLLAACVVTRRRWVLWTVPIVLPALLALAAALASVVLRHVPNNVATFALRLVFQPMLFYFLGFLVPKNRRWVRGAVSLFLLAGVALALHGIYQYVTHAPIPKLWLDAREGAIGTRAFSIVENPNGLGAVLLIGVLVSMSLAMASKVGTRRRSVMGLTCVILLCGEAVTFSRGGWLGLIAGVVALLVLAYRRYLVPLVGAAVVGWFVMPRTMINRLTFAFSSTYIAQSMMFGRLHMWAYALRSIAAHPLFGVGLGVFGGTSAVRFRYGTLWVDNFYLQLAAEGGLILLALFLWTLLAAARGLVQGYRATIDPYTRALTAGVFAGFVAVAAANLTASVWETLTVSVGFWFMAGLATSACFQPPEPVPEGGGK